MSRDSSSPSEGRFEPLPPATPQEWRRRLEAAHAYEPFPAYAFHVAAFAANLPPEATEYPMSRRAYAALRHEFNTAGIGRLTQDELCRAVLLLHSRHLAAPWWRKLTPAQLDRYTIEGPR